MESGLRLNKLESAIKESKEKFGGLRSGFIKLVAEIFSTHEAKGPYATKFATVSSKMESWMRIFSIFPNLTTRES
jgi:hypothetical protein